MGIIGFFIMFIMLCIAAGQGGYDKGLQSRGRKEAIEKGKVWYVDGKGITRSVVNKRPVNISQFDGCHYVYDSKTLEIIKDYNAEKIASWNQELKNKGAKGKYAVVWFGMKHENQDKVTHPVEIGNYIIRIDTTNNRPYVLEKASVYDKITKESTPIIYMYYFKNDRVQIYSTTYKKYTTYHVSNVDEESKRLLSKEDEKLYDLNKIPYYCKYIDGTQMFRTLPPSWGQQILDIK